MNEDLKWLAENVHEWRDGCCLVQRTGEHFYFLGGDDLSRYGGVGDFCFTRDQWQAARDELSGKPSWDDVVGEWIAQDEDGEWFSFDSRPYHIGNCWDVKTWYREKYGKGEVLGDWRNTLERRPENHSVEPTEKVWRGPEDGLPPVGAECEYTRLSGQKWFGCTICGYHGINVWLCSETGYYHSLPVETCKFRPIRSEEDEAVEEMMQISGKTGDLSRCICTNLYRAGYRKQEDK